MKARSKVSKMLQGKGCMTLNPTSEGNQLELPLFATVESHPQNSETTSTDKLVICNPSTQKQKSLKISALDSTSREKVCNQYWTDLCAEISSRLSLPVGTDWQDSGSSLYSTWSNKTVEKSWFSTNLYIVQNQNLPKIYSQFFTSFPVECPDLENTVKKSKKICLKLSPQQKQTIKKWFGVSRFVYNQTIEYLRQPGTKANWKGIKTGILQGLPEWCKEVPYQIKSIAIKDACIAVKKAKKKYQEGGGISQCRFRSRKSPIQSCYIPKSAVKDNGIYHTILGEITYKESLPANIGDCRLVMAYSDCYLCCPITSPRLKSENQGRVVALDPGIRTFLTFFSEDSFGWLGQAANIKIQKLCFKLDRLISQISTAKSRRKKRLKKAATRMRGKLKALVDELHKKIAKFLVDNFDVILLPNFETSQMSKKGKRRIRSKSVRQMLSLSHYKFKQFVKHKALEHNKIVVDVNEAYTSKTVSWTGEIIKNLSGSKIIKSPRDGRILDRDINGARGIFLRALVDTPWLRDNLNLCVC